MDRANTRVHILLTFVLSIINHVLAATECDRGYYMISSNNKTKHCLKCAPGSYMPKGDHTDTSCLPCSEVTDPGKEILITECNATHDAIIGCKGGYFRHVIANGQAQCNICRDCQYEETNKYIGQNCSTHSDTMCCPNPDMSVIYPDNGAVCVDKGQDSRSSTAPLSAVDIKNSTCLPCPEGTIVENVNRSHEHCTNCSKNRDPSNTPDENNDSGKIIGICIGLPVAFVVIVAIVACIRKKRPNKTTFINICHFLSAIPNQFPAGDKDLEDNHPENSRMLSNDGNFYSPSDNTGTPADENSLQPPTNHVNNTWKPADDPLLSPNHDQFPAADEDLEDNPPESSRMLSNDGNFYSPSDNTGTPADENSLQPPTNHVNNTWKPADDPLLSPNHDQFPAADEDLEDNPPESSRMLSNDGNFDSVMH